VSRRELRACLTHVAIIADRVAAAAGCHGQLPSSCDGAAASDVAAEAGAPERAGHRAVSSCALCSDGACKLGPRLGKRTRMTRGKGNPVRKHVQCCATWFVQCRCSSVNIFVDHEWLPCVSEASPCRPSPCYERLVCLFCKLPKQKPTSALHVSLPPLLWACCLVHVASMNISVALP
jgi:hypothetical protein